MCYRHADVKDPTAMKTLSSQSCVEFHHHLELVCLTRPFGVCLTKCSFIDARLCALP